MDDAQDMTLAEFTTALQRAHNLARQKNDGYREKLRDIEDQMRTRLKMIANRAERKEI